METTLNNQTKKFTLILGIVVAILISTTLPSFADDYPITKEGVKNSQVLSEDYLLLKNYFENLELAESTSNTNQQSAIIYDDADNLIIEFIGTVDSSERLIQELISRSDLLMILNGKSYYKLNE